MNVNTENPSAQANAVNTTLPLSQIKQHLGDIEESALSARALCDITYEQIDAMDGEDAAQAVVRFDALVKATHRNTVLIQESVEAIGALFREVEGGAQ
jgi:hypothetical protein